MRNLVGVGTPRSLHGRRGLASLLLQALLDALAALVAWWARRRWYLATLGASPGPGWRFWLLAGTAGGRPRITLGLKEAHDQAAVPGREACGQRPVLWS